MSDALIEGQLRHRNGKKWKARYGVVKKVSPVADCLTLCLFKDETESRKSGKEKTAISLKNFIGLESGFQLEKEANVLAVLCGRQVELLAFARRETLIHWQVKLREHLGQERSFPCIVSQAPTAARLSRGPVRLFVHNQTLCLVADIPPKILLTWLLTELRKFGAVGDDRFAFEGGQKCEKGCGQFVLLTEFAQEINYCLIRQSDSYRNTRSPQRDDPLRAPTIPRRPSLALAPNRVIANTDCPGPPHRQHSAPATSQGHAEGILASQGQGRNDILSRDINTDANEAYCDEAWLRRRQNYNHSNDDVFTLDQSDSCFQVPIYQNHSPTKPKSNKLSTSSSFRSKLKQKLPIFHRHSKSSDQEKHSNSNLSTCSSQNTTSGSKHRLPVAHAHSRSADDIDGEGDFMDLSAYLWHTRKEGSASARNIAWEESILRKTHSDILRGDVSCNIDCTGSETRGKEVNTADFRRYENQEVIDAQVRDFQKLDIQTKNHHQGAQIHQSKTHIHAQNEAQCFQSETIAKPIVSPGALSNRSLCSRDFHCSMNLVDEVLQAVDSQVTSVTNVNAPNTNTDLDSLCSEQQHSNGPITAVVSNVCTGSNKPAKCDPKTPSLDTSIVDQIRDASVGANQSAIHTNNAINTTNIVNTSDHQFLTHDNLHSINCCDKQQQFDQNGTFTSVVNLSLPSSQNRSDIRATHESTCSPQCQKLNCESGAIEIVQENTELSQQQLNRGQRHDNQISDISQSHASNSSFHLERRCAKLITAQSLPNVNIDPTSLIQDEEGEQIGHIRNEILERNTMPKSNQESITSQAKQPLAFVDLSKFDGIDEGYLYWLKANSESCSQSTRMNQLGYDNVRAHSNSGEYINMPSGSASQTGYDNVNYSMSKTLKGPCHNYDNIGNENSSSGFKSPVDVTTEQTRLASCSGLESEELNESHRSHSQAAMYCNTGVITGPSVHTSTTNVKTSDANNQSSVNNHTNKVAHRSSVSTVPSHFTKPPAASTIPKTRHSQPKHSSGWSGLAFHGSLRRNKKRTPVRGSVEPGTSGGNRNAVNNTQQAGSYVTLRTNAQIETSATSSLCTIPIATAASTGDVSSHTSSALLFIDYSDPQKDNLMNTITEQQRSFSSAAAKHSPKHSLSSAKHSPHGKHSRGTAEVANLMPAADHNSPRRSHTIRSAAGLNVQSQHFQHQCNSAANQAPHAFDETGLQQSDFVMVRASTYNKSPNKPSKQPSCQSRNSGLNTYIKNEYSCASDKRHSNPITDIKKTVSVKNESLQQNAHYKLDTRVPVTKSNTGKDTVPTNKGLVNLWSIPPSPARRIAHSRGRECDYIDMSNPLVVKTCSEDMNQSFQEENTTYLLAPTLPPKLPPKLAVSPGSVSGLSAGSSSNSSLASVGSNVQSTPTKSQINKTALSSPEKVSYNADVKGNLSSVNAQCNHDYVTQDAFHQSSTGPQLFRMNSAPVVSLTDIRSPVVSTTNGHTPEASTTSIHSKTTKCSTNCSSPYMDMTFMLASRTLPKTASESARSNAMKHGSSQKLHQSRSLDTTLDDDPYLDMAAIESGKNADISMGKNLHVVVPAATRGSKTDEYLPMKAGGQENRPAKDGDEYLLMKIGGNETRPVKSCDEYLPMKGLSRQTSSSSLRVAIIPESKVKNSLAPHEQCVESTSDLQEDIMRAISHLDDGVMSHSAGAHEDTNAPDSSKEDTDKPIKPFDLLDMVSYDKSHKAEETKKCQEKAHERELLRPFDLLDLYDKSSRRETSPSKSDTKGDRESSQTPPTSRRNSKSQGLFARLMRRNSSAKELAKTKSQEDILENDLSSQVPPATSPSPTKSKKEPIYAQIPEFKGTLPREPHTMPLKKKEFLRLSSSESLLDPDVKNEQSRFQTVPASTNRTWLEHGNLTDEQKQSCASLLSNRSMTPPTPPPSVPLPPPPLPPRPGRTSLGAAPPVPPKTYMGKEASSRTTGMKNGRKQEPEYADIDENGFYKIPGAPHPIYQRRGVAKGMEQVKTVSNDSMHFVEYIHQSHEQTTASFFPLDNNVVTRPDDQSDYANNPPPRPPRQSTIETAKGNCMRLFDHSQNAEMSYDHEDEQEEPIWVEREFPQVKPKPGRLRLSLRSLRHTSQSSDTFSLTSHHSVTSLQEPSSPFRTIDAEKVTSPAATVLRPRAGKEYQVIDRRRLLGGGGDEGLSSGPSSGAHTPASLQSSPSKSPSSSKGQFIFNFDPAVVNQHSTDQQRKVSGDQSSVAENPSTAMGTKAQYRRGDPDPIYMNLTFPHGFSRPRGSLILEPSRRTTHAGNNDYANVVLNYAEIDLSHSSNKNHRQNKNVRNKNNKDDATTTNPDRSGGGGAVIIGSGNAVTEYSVIDMVATMAASQAAKDHVQSREDSVALKQRHRRHNDVSSNEATGTSKENNSGKRKEKRSAQVVSGAKSFLTRSHSAVSRTSNSSRDRKVSLNGNNHS